MLVLAILGAQCTIGMVFSVIAEFLPSHWPLAARAAFGVAAAALMLVLVIGVMARLAVPAVGAAIEYTLAEGRCPSCGYDLKQCEPAPDGCSVCPECGAAWRVGTPARSTAE